MPRLSFLQLLAVAMVAASAPESAAAATDPSNGGVDARLPIGNGPEFRDRLLSWRGVAPAAPIAAREFRLPAIVTRISSYFGVRDDPLDRAPRMHTGIDLPDRFGAPVVSAAGGLVVSAGWAQGYGNMVEVDHGDGVRTRYAHLSRVLVFAGQTLVDGETLGLVGSTGRSTGNHLHFEVRQDGRATDPLTFAWQPPAVPRDVAVPVRQRRGDWQSAAGDSRLPMPSLD